MNWLIALCILYLSSCVKYFKCIYDSIVILLYFLAMLNKEIIIIIQQYEIRALKEFANTIIQSFSFTCGELVLSSLQLHSVLCQSPGQYKHNFYQKYILLMICFAELVSYWIQCYIACIVTDWQSHHAFCSVITCQLHNEKKAAIHNVPNW